MVPNICQNIDIIPIYQYYRFLLISIGYIVQVLLFLVHDSYRYYNILYADMPIYNIMCAYHCCSIAELKHVYSYTDIIRLQANFIIVFISTNNNRDKFVTTTIRKEYLLRNTHQQQLINPIIVSISMYLYGYIQCSEHVCTSNLVRNTISCSTVYELTLFLHNVQLNIKVRPRHLRSIKIYPLKF